MTENEVLSNADTAAEDLKASPVAQQPLSSGILPPRTGYLRTNWYKRNPNQRQFPTSCAAGLAVVATTLFTLGLILAGAKDVSSPAILLGSLFFSSGLVQIITGIWAIVDDNLFGSVFLLSYGAFFMSLGYILNPGNGIADAYADTADYTNALGLFLAAWTVLTGFLWIATIKSTVPLFVLMTFLLLFFILYTCAVFKGKTGLQKAAGVFCFLVSVCAYYAVWDGMSSKANAYVVAPEGKLLRMPGSMNEPSDPEAIETV